MTINANPVSVQEAFVISRQKTYTAPDGANFYEVVQYPAQEYGLRVEYWSEDDTSTITYL